MRRFSISAIKLRLLKSLLVEISGWFADLVVGLAWDEFPGVIVIMSGSMGRIDRGDYHHATDSFFERSYS